MSSELCAQENRLAASRIASSTRHKSTPDSGKPVTEGSSRGHTRKGPTAVPGPIRDNYSCRLLSRQMQVVALMQYRIDRWRRSQTGKIHLRNRQKWLTRITLPFFNVCHTRDLLIPRLGSDAFH